MRVGEHLDDAPPAEGVRVVKRGLDNQAAFGFEDFLNFLVGCLEGKVSEM